MAHGPAIWILAACVAAARTWEPTAATLVAVAADHRPATWILVVLVGAAAAPWAGTALGAEMFREVPAFRTGVPLAGVDPLEAALHGPVACEVLRAWAAAALVVVVVAAVSVVVVEVVVVEVAVVAGSRRYLRQSK